MAFQGNFHMPCNETTQRVSLSAPLSRVRIHAHGRIARMLVAAALACGALSAAHVQAEGSRDLYPASYPAGGNRAAMDVRTGSSYASVVAGRQFLYVYARTGE